MYTNLLLYIYLFYFLIIIKIKIIFIIIIHCISYYYNSFCHSNCIVLLSSISFSSALFYFINSIYFILLVLFIYLFYTLLALL